MRNLRDLGTDYTRLQLWYSVPLQAVAQLKEPTATETFWDFRNMDSLVLDFYANTSGKRHLNIGTIPAWMFDHPQAQLPDDPGATDYAYSEAPATALKDPSGEQFAAYQARIFQWYTRGGFTDELGKFHKSGHFLKIDYWGILNEPPLERGFSVAQYTRIYDAVVHAIRAIDPDVKFFGPDVVKEDPAEWARYFLDKQNHRENTKIDVFSFHNYLIGPNSPDQWNEIFFSGKTQEKFFAYSAARLPEKIKEIMEIRDRLSPETEIAIDELGVFVLPDEKFELSPAAERDSLLSDAPYADYNPLFWAANGANFAANYINAQQLGLRLISMTQLLGYPTQSPATTMTNWETGKPNAHWWVLKLLTEEFQPGDVLIATQTEGTDFVAQAVLNNDDRKILLVNTTDKVLPISFADAIGDPAIVRVVDEETGEEAPKTLTMSDGKFELEPFAVAVVKSRK